MISLPPYTAAPRAAQAPGVAHRGRPGAHQNIPQYDGGDDDDDEDNDDDLGVGSSPRLLAPIFSHNISCFQQVKKETQGDDEDLGSDLDDEEGEEPDTDNIVLCQFEKVSAIRECFCDVHVFSLLQSSRSGDSHQKQEKM